MYVYVLFLQSESMKNGGEDMTGVTSKALLDDEGEEKEGTYIVIIRIYTVSIIIHTCINNFYVL